MDLATKRKWEIRLGVLTPAITLLSVLIGVWQFNSGEKSRIETESAIAIEKDNLEFRRRLWLEQVDRYRNISELVGRIVALPPGEKRDTAIVEFESAYWGSMILDSDEPVAAAMIGFRQALHDQARGIGEPDDIKIWANTLVQACRKALAEGSPEGLARRKS